jgi:death on curing protein
MFILNKVLQYIQEVLKFYGGALGIRAIIFRKSALNRPFQTFGWDELYSGPFEKSAAIIESIILNHPFVNGNKRNGCLLGATLLLEYNIVLTVRIYCMIL